MAADPVSPKWDICINPHPSRFREHYGRWDGKKYESEDGEGCCKMLPSRHGTASSHQHEAIVVFIIPAQKQANQHAAMAGLSLSVALLAIDGC